MVPEHLEVGRLSIVGHSFVAGDGLEIRDVESSGIFVSFDIARFSAQAPGAEGVDLAGEGEVNVVAECEVVTAVAEIVAAVVVIAKGGEYDTG